MLSFPSLAIIISVGYCLLIMNISSPGARVVHLKVAHVSHL